MVQIFYLVDMFRPDNMSGWIVPRIDINPNYYLVWLRNINYFGNDNLVASSSIHTPFSKWAFRMEREFQHVLDYSENNPMIRDGVDKPKTRFL